MQIAYIYPCTNLLFHFLQIYWLGDLPGNASERPGFTRVEYGGDDLNVSQLEEEGYTQLNAQTDEISLEDIK